MNRVNRKKSKVLDDASLIQLIQQGEAEAFAVFYERHRGTMYLAAYHLLRDADDAADAVQELFSSIWQEPDHIDPNGNIKGYLYTILRNRVLSAFARSKYVDEYASSFLAFERQFACSTEETVVAKDLAQILEEKISQLPARMREVYELSWYEDLTNKEISKRMSITEGTVKQHKYQALRILRRQLQRLVSILF